MIESNHAAESVSRTLEYAYDDWCISQMGQVLSLMTTSLSIVGP